MSDKPNNGISSIKKLVNFKLILTFTIYIIVFVVYYFMGLKNTTDQNKDYNDLPVFLSILLYVYNIYLFYSYHKNGIKKDDSIRVWIQTGLFYILNICLLAWYFQPFEKYIPKPQFDPSGNIIDPSTDVYPTGTIQANKVLVFFGIVFSGLIALIFGILSIIPQFANSEEKFKKTITIVFKILTILFAFFGIIFTLLYSLSYTPLSLTAVMDILNIGILIGLASAFASAAKYLIPETTATTTKGSWSKLIFQLLFYIPCLFIDLINYLKKEVKSTTSTYRIILLIEIILIVLRIVVPIIYRQVNKLTNVEGKIVEDGPVYTNIETNLGVLPNSNFDLNNLDNKTHPGYNYNYALSCDIWINPQPVATNDSYSKSTTLLNYGGVLKINFNQNKIEIYADTTDKLSLTDNLIKIYELENIPYQKWNSFIFNYDGGTLDIFINSRLVSSTMNITPIMQHHMVIAGTNNGIYGGIKNIIYYDKVLSGKQIESIATAR